MAQDRSSNEVKAYLEKIAPELGMDSLLIRTTNALVRGGINTMKKLSEADEEKLARVRNMGEKTLAFALLARDRYRIENT